MSRLFLFLLAMTLAGTTAALFILALKRLLRDRLAPAFSCYIWLPALFLFLCPLSFPVPAAVRLPLNQVFIAAAPAENTVSAASTMSFSKQLPQGAKAELPLAFPLLTLWACGIAFFFLVRIVDYRRLKTFLATAAVPCGKRTQRIFERALDSLARVGHVSVAVCPGVTTPLVVGLAKPVIYLPHEDFSRAQLDFIFAHELTHLRYKDHWLKGFALLVNGLQWWNPICYALGQDLEYSCELCCDGRVTREMDAQRRKSYGHMLLDMASGQLLSLPPMATAFVMDKRRLQRRLGLLIDHQPQTALRRAIAMVLGITVALVGAAVSAVLAPARTSLDIKPLQQAETMPESYMQALAEAQQEAEKLVLQDKVLSDSIYRGMTQEEMEEERTRQRKLLGYNAAQDGNEQEIDVSSSSKSSSAAAASSAAADVQNPPEVSQSTSPSEPSSSGSSVSEEITDDTLQTASSESSSQGASASSESSHNTSRFLWPVNGGYVSCSFRGYYGHEGMDIAADKGTEIYAAADGVVTYAQNTSVWPYGKNVIIDHGSGYQTRYAHCSSVLVSEGQTVSQGELIALVGRTGNASGPHCHFEVWYNGIVQNPAKYIGSFYSGG